MNCILNEIFESKKFTEIHPLYSKSFKENIRRNKKFCQRDVDDNKDSTIQSNNKIIIFIISNFKMPK